MMTLSVFTGYSAQLFRDDWLEPLGPKWVGAFPIPSQPFEIYVWSLSTAAFYIAAIFGALSVRNTRIANRIWFDLNNLDRDRPILRYVTPTLMGAALGCLTLFAIALVGGPGFKPEIVTAQVGDLVQDRRRDFAKDVGSPVRASMMAQPCFLAVEKNERMSAKSTAPSTERKPPEIFWRNFIMRPSRSA